MSDLPKRNAAELARDLRVRADLLSGQSWEVPATAAMMREAADLLAAPSAEADALRAALRGLVEQWRSRAIAVIEDVNHGHAPTREADAAREWQGCADELDALLTPSGEQKQ